MRAALPIVVLLAALLAVPSTAGAYKLGGQKWPKRTITYYDGGPDKAAMRMAVRAWNASGARVRFKAASRGSAAVLVKRAPGFCSGFAQLGYSRHTRATVSLARCSDLSSAAIVAAHELGHILGLNHEERGCTTMSSLATNGCKPPPAYFARCRLLQRDDVRGAVRRYGGRVKALGADFCPRWSAPELPTGLTVTDGSDPDSTPAILARLSVPRPKELLRGPGPPPRSFVSVYRYANACPSGAPTGQPLGPAVDSGAFAEGFPVDDRLKAGPGRFCYAFWVENATGRNTSRAVTATIDVRIAGPRAVLDPPDPVVAGEETYFSHSSEQGEAGIETQRWDFGDGSSSDQGTHIYAQPGTYTVTLTVSDRYGQSSSASQQITVAPA